MPCCHVMAVFGVGTNDDGKPNKSNCILVGSPICIMNSGLFDLGESQCTKPTAEQRADIILTYPWYGLMKWAVAGVVNACCCLCSLILFLPVNGHTPHHEDQFVRK